MKAHPRGNGAFAWLSAILSLLGGLLLTFALQSSLALSVLNLPRTLVFALAAVLFGLLADEVGRGKVLAGGVALSAPVLVLAGRSGPGLGQEVCLLLLAVGLAMVLSPLLSILLAGVRTERLLATAAGLYLAVGGLASLVARSLFQVGTLQVGRLDLQVGTFQLPLELGILHTPFGPFGGYLAVVAGLGGLLLALAGLSGRRLPSEDPEVAGAGRRLPLLLLASWLATASLALVLAFLSPLAQERAGVSYDTVRFLLMALPVPVVLVQFLGGPAADLFEWAVWRMSGRRGGRAVAAALGVLLLVAGFVLLLLATDISALTNAVPIVGIGYGLLGPSLLALVAGGLPRGRWGLAAGLYLAVTALAGSPCLALLGDMPASTALYLALALAALISLPLVVLFVRPGTEVSPDVG
ncbi:MAG: hypothetical protein ACP5OO_00565 [Chloroflexia bacterium]